MCGIIGIVGKEPVADRLIESLKRLEYRGYDSAGVAGVVGGQVERRRAQGKIKAWMSKATSDERAPLPRGKWVSLSTIEVSATA